MKRLLKKLSIWLFRKSFDLPSNRKGRGGKDVNIKVVKFEDGKRKLEKREE